MINQPVIIILIPLFFAFLIPLISVFSKKIIKIIPVIAAFINLAAIIKILSSSSRILKYFSISGYKIPFGINLIFNYQIGMFLFAINLVALIAFLYFYKNEFNIGNKIAYPIAFTLGLTAANGMILTGDLFNLFVFMELAAISGYIISSHRKGYYSTITYIVITSIGSLLFLLGTASVYNVSGSLSLNTISTGLQGVSGQFIIIISVLFIISLSGEAELIPLNSWVPKVYNKTGDTGRIFFGSIFSSAALFAVIKVLILLFQGSYSYIYEVITVIGLITLFIGEVVAFRQENIKKMIAYSSVAQAGLIIGAVSMAIKNGIINKMVFNAAIFQLFNNIFAKGLILLGVGALGAYHLNNLKNNNKKLLASILTGIGVLSLIGMPPFAGFWSKFYLIKALVLNKFTFFIIIFLFSALFEVYYYMKFLQKLFFSEGNKTKTKKDISFLTYGMMVYLSAIILLIGIFPNSIYKAISDIFMGGIL
ncbi:MAG TPA: proton-conducting transporter membrane subunit [Candidatus Mcinerneyibacterium sp.]|nr:proton-conducting transporter membrane subunit [Candidatus Mcinerneyibacterium sp.]